MTVYYNEITTECKCRLLRNIKKQHTGSGPWALQVCHRVRMGEANKLSDFLIPTLSEALRYSPSFLLPMVMLPTNLPKTFFIKDYCWWQLQEKPILWMKEESLSLVLTQTGWGVRWPGHWPPPSKPKSSRYIPSCPISGGIPWILHLSQISPTVPSCWTSLNSLKTISQQLT